MKLPIYLLNFNMITFYLVILQELQNLMQLLHSLISKNLFVIIPPVGVVSTATQL